jgi:phosphoglucosamine mutase
VSLTFGTDGVRGDADVDLTPELVHAFARAAATVLGDRGSFLVGRDTRESGPRIVADLVAGLAAGGARCIDLGVAPTPAVAFHSAAQRVPGAMVSASHNLWSDNGIKLFTRGGDKLDDPTEDAIEAELRRILEAVPDEPPARDTVAGEPGALAASSAEMSDRYVEHLHTTIGGRRLDGMRVVLDCANGAASFVAPQVFRQCGAQVVVIHASPDGRNINDQCGSTHPDDLRRAVLAAEADVGLAFDGDADRVVAVDEHGEMVDGDAMLVIAALDLEDRSLLRNGGVAVTVMSNLGLRRALTDAGITVVTTPVGDRNVLAALVDHGLALGGEQSGHIVFADHATTGDGLLTGLFLLDCMRRAGAPLSALAQPMVRYPQVLESVRVAGRVDLDDAPALWDAVAIEEEALGESGRVLVRASGTEPVVRVMVEAQDRAAAEASKDRLVDAVLQSFPPNDS